MDGMNKKTYADTENSFVDTVFEFIPVFIDAIPLFGDLPFDEMFRLVNWYFENQVTVYNDDYDLIKANLICDLKCFVQANGNIFDWDVWDEWLVYIGEQYPDNKAAGLFARYAPVRNTLVNQIAELLNQESSLQQYFDTLSIAWVGGLLTPADCSGCDDCPPLCLEPNFTIINPGGTLPGGTVDVTDNMDGTWTVVGTSALDGDNRLLFCDLNCCWNVVSVVYSVTPENLNSYYQCGAQPTDSDIGNGAAGNPDPAVPDICIAGILAASASTAFTVTLVIEAC